MFAVLCSPNYLEEIEKSIASLGEQVIYKTVDKNIDFMTELKKIERLGIKHLIIDLTSITDQDAFIKAIRSFRIINDKAQVLIIAPNYKPGNKLIHHLVSMGIYDIIAPSGNLEGIALNPHIIQSVKSPSTYKNAVKWVIASDDEESIESKTEVKKEKPVHLEITKEKIVGTVVITVAGSQHNVGCTHTAIQLAYFLAKHEGNFKVAFLEAGSKKDLIFLNNDYPAAAYENSFNYKDIDFYSNNVSLVDLLALNHYNYIVLDIGPLKYLAENNRYIPSTNFDEMFRAHISILVCQSKPWQLPHLLNALKNQNSDFVIPDNWNIYFTLTDDKTYSELKRLFGPSTKVYNAPYVPELFDNSDKLDSIFSSILDSVLPKFTKHKNKKRLFF